MFTSRGGLDPQTASPEKMQNNIQKWMGWVDQLKTKGVYKAGEALLTIGIPLHKSSPHLWQKKNYSNPGWMSWCRIKIRPRHFDMRGTGEEKSANRVADFSPARAHTRQANFLLKPFKSHRGHNVGRKICNRNFFACRSLLPIFCA